MCGNLLQWCLERHIKATRSRPYHKNDNCYAEQKNFDAVRKSVGYFQFDTPAEYAALKEVYDFICAPFTTTGIRLSSWLKK